MPEKNVACRTNAFGEVRMSSNDLIYQHQTLQPNRETHIFIPVWQWKKMEEKKETGKSWESVGYEREKKENKEEKRSDGDNKVKSPKGAMQSNNPNIVSVWLLNLAKENRLPQLLWGPWGGINW